jgi:hypothetical protein
MDFSPLPRVVITPFLRFAWQPYDTVFVKPYSYRDYFGSITAFRAAKSVEDNAFLLRARVDLSLFRLVSLYVSLQPEYSMTFGNFSRLQLETGIEARYRGAALGVSYRNRSRLSDTAVYGFSELAVYISFGGTVDLFPAKSPETASDP